MDFIRSHLFWMQLTRVAFKINDFLWNPHFNIYCAFRTAFSGSLSTLYFSAKSNCEDGLSTTDTLNWTMNGSTYDNFDELSDTSTLVGCEDLVASLDEVQNNRY